MVTNSQSVGPGAPRGWQAVLQRGIDTAAELSDLLAQKLGAAADPRAKLLRKRRWAFRLGLLFTAATAFWVGLTALLAVWSTPFWVLIITGVIAGVVAFPATLFFLRYRWLRAEPLPPQRAVLRLPPRGSGARQSMASLVAAERGLFSLLSVIQRGQMLPADEIVEVTAAANRTAMALSATASEVVSMELAARSVPQSRAHLVPTIQSLSAKLDAGVRQYGEIATAAAQLVSAVNGGPVSRSGAAVSSTSEQYYRDELVAATDRLAGWAQAFDELGRIRSA
ncbi:hypothetical protein [Mycobacterium sp. OTB74]|uniref:phage shock envelope stress response protein PspM n=1 Tax=Mycobacterium sp. OTB74 TaxID=1853452 RepID=UPI0024753E05|nr:hypothetical protein [Mycobacterium sp. OTB74]